MQTKTPLEYFKSMLRRTESSSLIGIDFNMYTGTIYRNMDTQRTQHPLIVVNVHPGYNVHCYFTQHIDESPYPCGDDRRQLLCT